LNELFEEKVKKKKKKTVTWERNPFWIYTAIKSPTSPFKCSKFLVPCIYHKKQLSSKYTAFEK